MPLPEAANASYDGQTGVLLGYILEGSVFFAVWANSKREPQLIRLPDDALRLDDGVG